MSSPVAYGIDFGTTNSSIAVAYTDKVELLPLNTATPYCMPSMVYLHREPISLAGEQALDRFMVTGSEQTRCAKCNLVDETKYGAVTDCRQYKRGGGCRDSRLFSELKTVLADSDFKSTHSWAKNFELPDLVRVVLQSLKRIADRHTGQAIDKVVIGHPVDFVGARSSVENSLGKERVVEAAYQSGFREVEPFSEPVAAVLGGEVPNDGITVAVDFGGGTFDVAVVNQIDGKSQVLSSEGAAIGGTDFDKLIFDNKLTEVLSLQHMPPFYKNYLRSLGGLRYLLTDPRIPGIIAGIILDIKRTDSQAGLILEEILFGGMAGEFYSAIEQAKKDLTDHTETFIDYQSSASGINILLKREEFDSWIAHYIMDTKLTIQKAMAKVSISPKDVHHVIRTGGSSNLRSFTEMLNDMFGPEKILSQDAFTTVAHGLGVHAQEKWGKSNTLPENEPMLPKLSPETGGGQGV